MIYLDNTGKISLVAGPGFLPVIEDTPPTPGPGEVVVRDAFIFQTTYWQQTWKLVQSSRFTEGAITTADVADSTDKRYVTEAEKTKLAASFVECVGGFIESPTNKDYRIVINIPYAGTINETTTRSASGTCTATFKINTTALGGTANSVSSVEQSQTHTTSNTFVAGDDIVITISSNSACVDMSFLIKITR